MKAAVLLLSAASVWASSPATPQPHIVFLEPGTPMQVRLEEPVDSETSYPTRKYRSSLAEPVAVDNLVLVPKGLDCTVTVTGKQEATRFKGRTSLGLRLTRCTYEGKPYDIETEELVQSSVSRGAQTGKAATTGAVLGALIGGGLGRSGGAAVAGSAAGAAIMTGLVSRTPKPKLTLPVETVLIFTLQNSIALGAE